MDMRKDGEFFLRLMNDDMLLLSPQRRRKPPFYILLILFLLRIPLNQICSEFDFGIPLKDISQRSTLMFSLSFELICFFLFHTYFFCWSKSLYIHIIYSKVIQFRL